MNKRRNVKSKLSWKWVVAIVILSLLIANFFLLDRTVKVTKVKTQKPDVKTKEEEDRELLEKAGEYEDGPVAALLRAQALTEEATIAQQNKDPEAGRKIIEELAKIDASLDENDPMTSLVKKITSVVKGLLQQSIPELKELGEEPITFANPEVWEQMYKDKKADEHYEWYNVTWSSPIVGASTLGNLIQENIPQNVKLLDMGCGDSLFSAELFEKGGYQQLHHMDVSTEVINRMSMRYPNAGKWEVQDATNMTYPSESFGAIIEKGAFDAMEQVDTVVKAAAKETVRILKQDGILLSVSIRNTKQIEEWLDNKMECKTSHLNQESTVSGVFMHICRKKDESSDGMKIEED